MNITQAYTETLNEIEKSLKCIHYPLCDMEKYVFDEETDDINELVEQIHQGYMQIQIAINKLRKLRGE